MKAIALLAIVSLVWSARQPGKESDAEEQMPETIWIGSPYGLIPYDIDWAYFNKTKEHVLREADKQRKEIKARPITTSTSTINRKGSNEKQEVNETLGDILSTTTIEPITTLQSTTCIEEQEETLNEQFHTTESNTEIPEKETEISQKTGRPRTSPPTLANISSVSHASRTNRQRIHQKPATTTSRLSNPTTPSATQRTFPRIPYDIDDLLVASTVPSTSLMDAFRKSEATPLNSGSIRGSNATSVEKKKLRKEYQEGSNVVTRPSINNKANDGSTAQEESEDVYGTNADVPSTGRTNKPSTQMVGTLSRSSLGNSANNRKQNQALGYNGEISSNGREATVNTTGEEDERTTKTITAKFHGDGDCNRVADILAFSNYFQLKIIDSLLSGSVSWPRNERGQFRGMVNHMRRKLQMMTKKSSEKEQFKVIHAHLVKYMGDNRERQQLVLPIAVGDWGTVKQLLDCLKKKKL